VRDTVRSIADLPEPGAAMELGEKLMVTPVGSPVAERAIAESKPPETAVVTVAVPLWPWRSEPDVGETEMVKAPAVGAVTVSATVAVCEMPPPVPVTVMV
jgi:hypothetical protein